MAIRRTAPTDRATQWQDLSPTSHKVLNANVRANGQQRDALQANIDAQRKAAATTTNPVMARKTERLAGNLEKIAPYVRNVDVTHASAAKRRVDLFTAAGTRAEGEGRSTPRGYGWYFEHHGAIAGAAKEHGFDTDRAIVASAAMSPQNSPENERAAVSELMKLHAANPTINLSPKGARFLGVGKRSQVSAHELTPEQVGKLGDAKHRGTHISIPGVDQVQIARGGTQGNIAKAYGTLTQPEQPKAEDVMDPRTGAKVNSYTNNIRSAVPNSPVHDEYMGRLRDYQDPTQGRLDLHGLKHSTEGILNPEGNTAEDTWMNSVSMGQTLRAEGRTSIGKTIGSLKTNSTLNRSAVINGQSVTADVDPSVSREALRHAWNNRATQIAAKHLSKSMDTRMPAVAAQEVSWTEARIQAGKDPQYNAEMASAGQALKSTARSSSQAAITNDQLHQGGFFKGVQGSLQVNRKHLPPAAHQEGGR